MKVIYRISDGGYNKIKPTYVTKRGCFLHFIKIFKNFDMYIIADNVSEDTYSFLQQHIDSNKIIRTSLSNAGSFMFSVDFAIKNFKHDEKVYFAEDDYIYTQDAPKIIEEGLDIAQYSSGYDHPDKYINYNEGGNPFVKNGGELTRVILSKNRHWKITNSCCMTFATTVNIIKQDYHIFKKHCSTSHPYDFEIFCDLYKNKGRRLVSCIPAVSTHGEIKWLSKFIDWEKEFEKTL